METNELYKTWLAGKQAINVPEGWADSMMQRIDRYEGSNRNAHLDVQAWIDWLCTCMHDRVRSCTKRHRRSNHLIASTYA